jgi:hypothetical protein
MPRPGYASHRAFDAHLPLQYVPPHAERGPWVRFELATLPAAIVGEENEPAFVGPLQEHHAHGRRAVGRRRGERHCIGLYQACAACLREPLLELADRVRVHIALGERLARVFLSELVQVGGTHGMEVTFKR